MTHSLIDQLVKYHICTNILDGRLAKEILSDGSYWETTYQDAARTIRRVRKDLSHQTLSQESYSFDQHGNMISYTDQEGKTITREYDKLNRLKVEIAPGETPEVPHRRSLSEKLCLGHRKGKK